MSANTIRKLVLPVAGLGKRLLPLTLRTPKNLVKVCGKPILEYSLEEAAGSGIREVILITSPLHRGQFVRYLARARKKFPSLAFRLRVQERPGGNGHAVLAAYDLLEGEPFAVRFPDDIIMHAKPALFSLIGLFRRLRAPVVLLKQVPRRLTSRFGVVGTKNASFRSAEGRVLEITEIIEKPRPRLAPSNLTIVAGYALTPAILRNLKKVADSLPTVADDALPLAVGLQIELIVGGKVYGWQFPGTRLDCGTLDALRKAEKALQRKRQY
jgi:UTP--glucose-1-phosphate uridylyltransferase